MFKALWAISAAVVLLGSAFTPVRASVIQSNNHIPPPAESSTNPVVYNTSAGAYQIHSFFDIFNDAQVAPPPLGGSQINSFFDVFTEISMDIPGAGTRDIKVPNSGTITMRTTASGQSGLTSTYDTEMLALDVSGGGLPPGVMIRESPTLQSLGQTKITDIGGGQFRIDSFFDIFTELSVDNGASWTPASAPLDATGLPEPGSLTLLAVGGLAPCCVGVALLEINPNPDDGAKRGTRLVIN